MQEENNLGIPPEDLELARRRTEAFALMIIGAILCIVGPFLCMATGYEEQTACGPRREPNWGVFAVVEILGFSLLAYGDYLWGKVKHITWTKQAIREYETQKMRIGKETYETGQKIKCYKCGKFISPSSKFCPECGAKLNEESLGGSSKE